MHHRTPRPRPGALALSLVVALGSTACLSDELDPDLADLADLAEPAELVERTAAPPGEPIGEATVDDGLAPPSVAAAYSPWTYVAGWNCAVYFRYCKTSTRINWQFTANTRFDHVSTFGDAISYLTSNIDGVASGSKYRTRAGTNMSFVFDDRDTGCGTISWGVNIAQMPSC